MQIYDSRAKKKVDFVPINEGEVKLYVCGPTVYDFGHLGHGRSAVCFDVIRKYFIYKGFKVTFVSNYTDIDDKMINRAAEDGISVKELSEKIIPEYVADYSALGIDAPDSSPRATEFIDEMVDLIKTLEEKDFTYVLEDGVYFDISKYGQYGSLSGQNLEDLQAGSRVDVREDKRGPYDFVLWKFKKDGEPAWASPWGEGRPGWHIECSAMSREILGESFDIHGGGRDLLFPHHECEVAQSCAAYGEDRFAKYWMHNGFINVDNEKMSKSLGNFFTLKDIFKKYDPQVVRFMFLLTQYRNPIGFSEILLEQAASALDRLHNFVRALKRYEGPLCSEDYLLPDDFEKFMDNDFDTSGALGVIFDIVRRLNQIVTGAEIGAIDRDNLLQSFKKFDKVLGVIFPLGDAEIDDEVKLLIEQRKEARDNKDFAESDRIRDELLEKGIVLEDTPNGTIWKKV